MFFNKRFYGTQILKVTFASVDTCHYITLLNPQNSKK